VKIHAIVFNWKGQTDNAMSLERSIGRFVQVDVINSDEAARVGHPTWTHLDESSYFSAQWNAALNVLDGDVLFHVQADVVFDDFERLLGRVQDVFERYPVGVYEPKIDHPPVDYERSRLRELEPNLFEVPVTDCTCWFIATSIVRATPRIDVSVNTYGWGASATIAAACRQAQRVCVRDYSFVVHHRPGRGYPLDIAKRQRVAHINGLRLDLAVDSVRALLDAAKLKQK
jgi:hypothetical protein